MTAEPGSVQEAAERNAQAVMTGNLAQLMADITPEALTQMMTLGAQSGGLTPGTMPGISGYELTDLGETAEGGHRFRAAFTSTAGTATIDATWKQVMGQWKIAGIELVSAERTAPEA